jgi:anhydro-N-acetylmuramic acid kinase
LSKKQEYKVIGVMSGTSLDGLDLAYCHFQISDGKWSFQLKQAVTIPYDLKMSRMLSELDSKSALEFALTDVKFGEFIGKEVNNFIEAEGLDVDFISSHGHTIFHQPLIGLTAQIGNGATISAITELPVVNNFRECDVALGGQGAPLVPIGDRSLFGEYKYCLNLGGIANISFETYKGRMAFDIAPCNIALNTLANQLNAEYDEGGKLAADGKANQELLDELNALDYFQSKPPKSLGKEWVVRKFLPILEDHDMRIKDKLATVCHHVGMQVAKSLAEADEILAKKYSYSQILVTGGGAFNNYLIEQINSYNKSSGVQIPSPNLIQFKEALIFAFLGVLHWRGEVNCLSSATGAKRDSSGGVIFEA